MSSSDNAMFTALEERVAALEKTVAELVDKAYGKDIMDKVYAAAPQGDDPVRRGPGRPPRET